MIRSALRKRFSTDGGKPFSEIRTVRIRPKGLKALDPGHDRQGASHRCIE